MSRSQSNNDNQPVQTSSGPSLCANNCGFFGSSANNNYCSKCFALVKDAEAKLTSPSSPAALPSSPVASPVTPSVSSAPLSLESSPSAPVTSAPVTPSKKNRCFSCNRKVGVLGFDCRCNNVFCSEHRYTYTHACPFDVRAQNAANITKANPKMSTAKFEKI